MSAQGHALGLQRGESIGHSLGSLLYLHPSGTLALTGMYALLNWHMGVHKKSVLHLLGNEAGAHQSSAGCLCSVAGCLSGVAGCLSGVAGRLSCVCGRLGSTCGRLGRVAGGLGSIAGRLSSWAGGCARAGAGRCSCSGCSRAAG